MVSPEAVPLPSDATGPSGPSNGYNYGLYTEGNKYVLDVSTNGEGQASPKFFSVQMLPGTFANWQIIQ